MQRERVADDIYVFTSDRYAQVTASVLITSEGAVLIDTLLYPDETRQIKQFVEGRLGCPVRYVVNTHYHADHTYGTCLFPSATVIAHPRCAELLDTRGRASLEQAKTSLSELADVQIVMPQLLITEHVFNLTVGNKVLQFWHTPGHSPDSIVCLAREDRVLFAADTLMALPYFVDGDYNDFLNSLQSLQNNNFENIVQGHGEVILRGEIEEKIRSDIAYLRALKKHVELALAKPNPQSYLQGVDIERCGKSRVLLNGTAQQLHRDNLNALFERMRHASQPAANPVETN
ncbi:MAG: MBL fold metallo-hydrolase [Chloroflexi bacterium CFX4]|nr:MBL fold metallo-hydrolase [Chloroflexi bacterium CFX4]MDL1923054.1 MBL fold metallo-hydrolase [Chloroflexi bacterium CFX3]